MKTLMYPIAPDDDFPEMFCAIRPYDGEHQFYTPEGESANELLFRMGKEATERDDTINILTDNNVRLRVDNSMLRELVRDMWRFTGAACKKYPRLFDPSAQGGQMVYLNMLDSFEQRMRDLGVEVEQ